ncbi:maleylpyruvate isomerase N-terminal domain-containing protein [Kocuria sabuli]|uniref:maleylpyruvate isomerase N-terminal domain-containing protein n=1 Tax=Kocuria sabuli TaxID=3071448 RepID=UPI0034D717AF
MTLPGWWSCPDRPRPPADICEAIRRRVPRGPALTRPLRRAPPGPGRDPASWQDSRRRVLERLAALTEGERIPWIGPPMGAPMMASARIMETFAHG